MSGQLRIFSQYKQEPEFKFQVFTDTNIYERSLLFQIERKIDKTEKYSSHRYLNLYIKYNEQ